MVVTDLIRYFEAWCCNLSLLVGVGGSGWGLEGRVSGVK